MSSSARNVYRSTSDNGYYIKISPKGLFGPAEYGEDDQNHGKRKQESGRDGADEIADRDRILQDQPQRHRAPAELRGEDRSDDPAPLNSIESPDRRQQLILRIRRRMPTVKAVVVAALLVDHLAADDRHHDVTCVHGIDDETGDIEHGR